MLTPKGAIKIAAATLVCAICIVILFRLSHSPLEFISIFGGVVGVVLLILLLAISMQIPSLKLARRLQKDLNGRRIFTALRTPALVQSLTKLGYRDEIHADMSPQNFPMNLVCSLEENGLKLWGGSSRAPRVLLAIPWRDCTDVGFDGNFDGGDKYFRVLLISTDRGTLVVPVTGGPLGLFSARKDLADAVYQDAMKRWQEYRLGPTQPMVSANSEAFRFLWHELAQRFRSDLNEEDRFDETMYLLDLVARANEAQEVPIAVRAALDEGHRVSTLDELVPVLLKVYDLQR